MSNGPIWARPEPGARKASLSRDLIARTAVELVDAEGHAALSMRRIAQALGVGTMTLYHYVATKDELLALIDDAVMSELVIPEGEFPEHWRDALSEIAMRTHAVHRRHPWLIKALGEPQMRMGPSGLRHAEQSVAALMGLGLTGAERMDLVTLIDEYVLGYALNRSVDEEADGPVDKETVEFFAEQIESGDYPALAALRDDSETLEQTWERLWSAMLDDGRFRRGLDRLLDGIELEFRRRGLVE